jgi:hypothetical protein
MRVSTKFLAAVAVLSLLALASVALAAGLTIKTTPAHPKKGQMVDMKVSGLKPGEKVKAVLTLPATGQKQTYMPKQAASAAGVFVNDVRAQIKGKNVWTYTGRTSHRKGTTSYTVR